MGNGIAKLLERALPQGAQTAENVARIRPAFLDYYEKHLTDFTRPYAGITDVLHALCARGIKPAVASNKYQYATEEIIRHFFGEIPFAAVLGQREGVPVKPDPQIVHEILARTGETQNTCRYVGDSETDMQTAKNAGVPVCAVTWGFRPQAELARFTPDFWAHRPQDILEIF